MNFKTSHNGTIAKPNSTLISNCPKDKFVKPKTKPAGVSAINKIINAVRTVDTFINLFDLKSVLNMVESDLMLNAWNICITPSVTNDVVIPVA